MTDPSDSSPHLYTDLVGEAFDNYARNQIEDTRHGLKETLRLWKEMYDAAGTKSGHDSKWLEWWSAAVHYSAASAANLGFLMTDLGAPRKYGTRDGRRPTRHIHIPKATKPRCVAFRRLGAVTTAVTTANPQGGPRYAPLDPNLVTFQQAPDQVGSDVWTVRFNLPAGAERGTYFVRIAPSGGFGTFIELHEYLDPTP